MKNFMNKFALLLLVVFVGFSLSACDTDETPNNYNTKVAYGSLLNDTTEYATLNGKTLTKKGLYDEMRVNAYDYLLDEMLNLLVEVPTYNEATHGEKVKEIINEKCYGTKDAEAIKEMNSATKKLAIEKFADHMYLLGVNIKNAEGIIDIYDTDCLQYFMKDYARKEYVRSLLDNEDKKGKYYWENENQKDVNGNDIKDENGKEIKNPYYISDDAIESAYNSNTNSENTYNVVIIKYDTLAEARAAYNWDNAITAYENFQNLYYERYSFKDRNALNAEENNFMLTEEELNSYNSSLVTLVKNMSENFEDLEKTYKFEQQFGSAVYSVYLNAPFKEADYASLEGPALKEAKTETKNKIIENKLTSSTISTLLLEKLYEEKVVINDFVFDALYSVENEKHTRLEANAFSNDFLVKVGEKSLSVETFYTNLEKVYGISTAMDYFTKETLAKDETYSGKVTPEDEEKINKEYDAVMASFEKNEFASSGLPASIGKDVFMFVYFGSTSEDEVKEYYKTQKIWNYYATEKDQKFYDKAADFGKQYAGEVKENIESKYFDLSVKHILLTVDYNGDGNPDDPEIFMSKLSDSDKTSFMTAIQEAMVAIVEEVNYLVDNDKTTLLNALDFVQNRFHSSGDLGIIESSIEYEEENGEKVVKSYKTWDDFKSKFNLSLKIEDLGSVNNSSASKYVSEFSVGVKRLYTILKAKADAENSDFSLSDDYLYGDILTKTVKGADGKETVTDTTHEERLAQFTVKADENNVGGNLIQTSFGYHILASYNSSSMTSARYTASSDKGGQYKEIKIKLNGEPVTIPNAYSDNKYATADQIKIYDAQLNTDDGITDLPPGAKTFISKFFSDFTSKYTNATFKNIKFAYENLLTLKAEEPKLTFADEATNKEFAEFIEIQKREFNSYATPEVNDLSIFANWWDIVLK